MGTSETPPRNPTAQLDVTSGKILSASCSNQNAGEGPGALGFSQPDVSSSQALGFSQPDVLNSQAESWIQSVAAAIEEEPPCGFNSDAMLICDEAPCSDKTAATQVDEPGRGTSRPLSTLAGPLPPSSANLWPSSTDSERRASASSGERERARARRITQLVELTMGQDHRRPHLEGSLEGSAGAGFASAVASKFLHIQYLSMHNEDTEDCSAAASKFLHMQYLSMHDDDNEDSTEDGLGDASTSMVVEKSAAMEKRAREECGSEDWGTHLDDEASRAKVARTEQAAGPSK